MLILENQALSEMTTTAIGGQVAKTFFPTSSSEVIEAVVTCNQNNWSFVFLAGGSNTLFADKLKENQAIISLVKFDNFELEQIKNGCFVKAQAGAILQDLVDLSQTISGDMTSLTRVPGSIGGAIVGNAGAYGTEIRDVFESVSVVKLSDIAKFGTKAPITVLADCNFGYRDSVFKQNKDFVVLEIVLKLKPTQDKLADEQKYLEISTKRDAIYPKGFRSPGSMFKNIIFSSLDSKIQAKIDPSWVVYGDKLPVGKLLEELNVKGKAFGGVKMTDRHPNIFHNFDNGSFADATTLISQIQELVWNRWNIKIEPEVRFIGSDFADFWKN